MPVPLRNSAASSKKVKLAEPISTLPPLCPPTSGRATLEDVIGDCRSPSSPRFPPSPSASSCSGCSGRSRRSLVLPPCAEAILPQTIPRPCNPAASADCPSERWAAISREGIPRSRVGILASPAEDLTDPAYSKFKRSVGLCPEAQLFSITGNPHCANLECVRTVLKERGYVENVWDPEGPWFDIKWGFRDKVDYRALAHPQAVNHFERDFELTTKSGLASHLRDCCTYADYDSSNFCPTTFHLNTAEAIEDFSREFMASKAMCVLKAWHTHIASGGEPSGTFQEGVVRIALAVCRRRYQDIDDLLDGDEGEAEQAEFSIQSGDIEVLREVDFDNPSRSNASLEGQIQSRLERERVGRQVQFLKERQIQELQQQAERIRMQEEARHCQRKHQFGGRRSSSTPTLHLQVKSSPEGEALTRHSPTPASWRLLPAELVEAEAQERVRRKHAEELSGHALRDAVQCMLETLRGNPTFHICERNIWIMKPAGKLRGQGIFLEDDVDRICRHARRMEGDYLGSYVCQQYIDNPLLIGGKRKHDIRQWVAVTSLNPLTIWFFNECYVRLAANEYTLDDITDRFTHLNNNAIISQHEMYDPEDEYWRCQWDQATYRKLLRQQFGSDVWVEKVLPQMKDIVVTSIKSVQEAWMESESHSCSFQFFGYDFLVDDALGVWLLEVNSNPLMHASCPVTERLCDTCLRDLFRVVLDGEDGRRDRPLQFDLLFRGPTIPDLQPDMKKYHEIILEGKRVVRPAPPPKTCSVEADVKAATQKLQAKRVQELQDLADKKRQQEEKKRQKAERATRIRTKLREKVLNSNHADQAPNDNAHGGIAFSESSLENQRHLAFSQSKSTPGLIH